jgi:hypothetical protein
MPAPSREREGRMKSILCFGLSAFDVAQAVREVLPG